MIASFCELWNAFLKKGLQEKENSSLTKYALKQKGKKNSPQHHSRDRASLQGTCE